MRFVKQPSPATVIASVALFVSLGGVSYGVATGSIDSREIKNNDVRTQDLRNGHVRTADILNNDVRSADIRTGNVNSSDVADNSLTGADVVESSLGTVPSASSAGSANTANFASSATNATNATNAANVDGMSAAKFSVSTTGTVTDAPVTSAGGLALKYDCGGGGINVNAEATTEADDARISASMIGEGAPPQVGFAVDEDFDSGETFDASPINIDEGQGTLTYRSASGTVVSAVYRASQGGPQGCIVEGTLLFG